MTLQDLQNDVYALGFERVTDPDDLFISAANRALRMIYTECKIKRSVTLRTDSVAVSSHIPRLRYNASAVTLPLVGRAYSMRVSGKGRFVIRDAESVRAESFDADDRLYRGFIASDCTLTLEGDYSYTVYDLTTYSEITSDRIESIPDGSGCVKYDFSEYPDFMAFSQIPKDERGKEVKDASIEGSILTLRHQCGRSVTVTYYRQPKMISADDLYGHIDIPRSAESALPLLCASFLWREDESELAEHYYALAKDMLKGVGEEFTHKSAKYTVLDGWA